jgi:hypothetical protein
MGLRVAVLLALLALPLSARAEVLLFDMGSDTSALWPGAHQVTPSDAGWAAQETPVAHDAPGDGSPIWTNSLTQDCIIGARPAGFSFAAAPGPWSVYVVADIGAHWDRSVSQYWDFTVGVDGERWRCQLPAPEWSGPYLRQQHVFATVSRGNIEVKLTPRSNWCIAGIIAWQPADDAEARSLIDKIEQWAPAEEIAKWREDVRPPAGPAPSLTAADRARGFYLWRRHWAVPIYPWTNPTPDELNPTLRVFAAPGEYEPITFTVRPLRDIRRAEIELEGLGPVPADRIDVRKVRYLRARPNYSDASGLYRVVPDILDRWSGGPLPPDENATFWLTLHLPDDAKPGLYEGRIRFSADGHNADIPVVLRVVEAQLREDPEHTYGIYYDDPLSRVSSAPDAWSREYWTRKSALEHADMAAHGTRNVTLDCWAGAMDEQGKFPYIQESFARLDDELKMAARYGFQPPYVLSISTEEVYQKHTKKGLESHLRGVDMPPEAFFPEVTALVRTIEAERRKRGWPEFVYQPYDEPSSDPTVIAFMARLMQAVKAAGVRTYTTASPEKPGYQPLKPYVDVWCTQTFLPDRDTVVADGRERGVEYWCYPNDISGENDHTPVAGARMTYGFGFWRSGFVRLIPWMYQHSSGDPFNYLDGRMMDFLVRSEPDGSPIPVALWEAYREGYDDMRYIYTLKQAIAEGMKSPSGATRQEAAEAQKVLDDIWNAVPVRPQYQYDSAWSPEEMDVYRWMIADQLERLTRLVRQEGSRPG